MNTQNSSLQNGTSPDNRCHKVTYICNLSEPLDKTGRERYSIFDRVKKEYGIYIVLDESGVPLYVGEATDQTLKKRIIQNYNKSSGGTFRKNFGGLKLFKEALRNKNWRIITISVQNKDEDRWIHVLEKALIGFLKPKYNMM